MSLCKPGLTDVEELKCRTLCCPQLVMLNFVDESVWIEALSRLKIKAAMHIYELHKKYAVIQEILLCPPIYEENWGRNITGR